MRSVQIERPHLDVVERREVGREQRADRTAADDADPQARPPSTGCGRGARPSTSSRPPVSPCGRRISTIAISAPTTTMRLPDGRSIPDGAVLGLGEQRVEAGDGERADDRAPEARHASDHEHGERDEREVEVHGVDVDRQVVDVQPAGEAGERAREREGDETLTVHRDADRARRRRVVARGAQLAAEATHLVDEGDRRSRRWHRSPPAACPSSPAPTRRR